MDTEVRLKNPNKLKLRFHPCLPVECKRNAVISTFYFGNLDLIDKLIIAGQYISVGFHEDEYYSLVVDCWSTRGHSKLGRPVVVDNKWLIATRL